MFSLLTLPFQNGSENLILLVIYLFISLTKVTEYIINLWQITNHGSYNLNKLFSRQSDREYKVFLIKAISRAVHRDTSFASVTVKGPPGAALALT